MSDPDPTGPEARKNPRFDDWPVAETEREYELVGTGGAGGALLYAPADDALVDAVPEESSGELVPDLDTERPLGDRSLGEVVEEFADEHGMDAISEFAREHLEPDSED